MITKDTTLESLDTPGVGYASMQRLIETGIITVGDYLARENHELYAVRLINRGKVARLDAVLAAHGFDTKARWESQYYQFPGTYVIALNRVRDTYHLIKVANAWDKRPHGLCGQMFNAVTTFRLPPRGFVFCIQCDRIIELERGMRG